MKCITKFVGLDISKDKIAVAVADSGTGSARYGGMFPNAFDTIRKVLKRIGEPEELYVCYEAGTKEQK